MVTENHLEIEKIKLKQCFFFFFRRTKSQNEIKEIKKKHENNKSYSKNERTLQI